MLFDKREVFVSYFERDLYQMQHALEQARHVIRRC